MGRHPINIGERVFASKTAALEHFKQILDFYQPGDQLSPEHSRCVIGLAFREWGAEDLIALDTDLGGPFDSAMVDYHPEFPGTKCFFLLDPSGESHPFSYRLSITGGLSADKLFSRGCREVVSNRLRDFKKECFRNRPVRCAITNEIVEWEECQIDHKSPLTFSVIVRSFIVASQIDTSSILYVDDGPKPRFSDLDLAARFDAFHKDMAVLRLVATRQNTSRASAARIKPTKKDATL
jgi:hypothetical protein